MLKKFDFVKKTFELMITEELFDGPVGYSFSATKMSNYGGGKSTTSIM